ncbi:MAG TPA: restriction endonuclease subunit S [Paludibacteraceae bacterium]|nr:restriction endonuclease subunit S [Paludibacteraceae bacterium]HOU69589.1 restriction endonuclease subunit S [Paludibacteraceae bacterium]HPH63964.1 restriction endonuclease subunit S [Paludibacteraceae bacterium]HQF51251.1 restriction endonuclease subunit S [Paludibacteraceae bacterium]
MELKQIIISDIGHIVTGKTPRKSIEENYGGDIPFLTPSDDLSNKYAPKTAKSLTKKGLNEVKKFLHQKTSWKCPDIYRSGTEMRCISLTTNYLFKGF